MDSYYNQYINQYRIYTAMSADKLASFRVDSQLWEQFQGYAKGQNNTATALLISYIKSAVNTGNVITSSQNINTSSQSNNPSLSIQDIDKRIDEKIKSSIQNIDTINTLSIQDIDNRIAESLADGGIGEAIAASYAGMMAQFNGLLEEWQELKKQFEELKSIPQPQINEELTIDNEELTTDNYQLPEQETGNREQGTGEYEDQVDSDLTSDTQSPIINDQLPITSHSERKPNFTRNYQIVSMLECQFWIDGKRFNQQDLKDNGIDKSITRNKAEIESILETEINTKNSVIQRFVGILRAMGFEVEGGLKDGYYIANPEIFN
jgi:hypothetical protein